MEPNSNPVAVPKPTPKWTTTPMGRLLRDGRPIGDLRTGRRAHHLRAFILAALNAAEEKL